MKKTFSIMACMLLLPCWGYAAQHDEEINHKNNYREYLNAAVAAANNMDIVLARDLYKQSVAQIAKDDKQALLDIDAEMAAVYIRNGANDVAADILQVHIDDNSATARMKADYLLALRNLGYVKEVEAAFERLYTSKDEVPVYGLQNMADMLFRAKKYVKAMDFYESVLAKDPSQGYARLSYAYCLAITGREEQAWGQYHKVAMEQPRLHGALAGDARHFVAQGKLGLARKIFGSLGVSQQQRQEYKLQYADSLAEHGYYYAANEIYEALLQEPALKQAALAGLAKNKARRGLYADALQLRKQLASENKAGAELFALDEFLDREQTGGSAVAYAGVSKDYKGNELIDFGIVDERYWTQNIFWSQEAEWSRYSKHEDSAVVRLLRCGADYRFERGNVAGYAVLYNGDYDNVGFKFNAAYNFSDYAELSMAAGLRPHGETGAILQEIDEKYWETRYSQRINEKTLLGFTYELGDLSDGNAYWALGTDITHNILNKPYHNNNLLLNYSYVTYDWEAPVYESPWLRVNYGVGVSQKLVARDGKRSMEFINMLSWGHDNDEPTDFNPYTKVEYVRQCTPQQRLVVGAEYGWRTNKLNNRSGLYYGHYNYYFTYQWQW